LRDAQTLSVPFSRAAIFAADYLNRAVKMTARQYVKPLHRFRRARKLLSE